MLTVTLRPLPIYEIELLIQAVQSDRVYHDLKRRTPLVSTSLSINAPAKPALYEQ